VTGSFRLGRLIRRLRKPGKEGIMTARPDAVAPLAGFDAERAGARRRVVRRDGRRFPAQQSGLAGSTTGEDLRAAASRLAAAPQRLTELIASCIRAVAGDTADRQPWAWAL
jgi:hypothetical protein